MSMQLIVGPDAITSYRRLDYSPWHAIAEFVDNSTQSYFDNRDVLDQQMKDEEDKILNVSVVYDRSSDFLRVADNAMGMSSTDLERALHVARPPANTNGRSKYGMGMKTAACWLGNRWTIKTKKLGESVEHDGDGRRRQGGQAAAGQRCIHKCTESSRSSLHNHRSQCDESQLSRSNTWQDRRFPSVHVPLRPSHRNPQPFVEGSDPHLGFIGRTPLDCERRPEVSEGLLIRR